MASRSSPRSGSPAPSRSGPQAAPSYPGVHPPETAIDPEAFIEEVEQEGVQFETELRTGR
ncbi:MAG: hypothetical protein ACT4PO_06285 [Actinomycetota bacterium]